MLTSLPSVTRIAYLPCEKLSPELLLRHKAGIPVAVFADTRTIRFFGTPTCETSTDYENRNYVEKTTLSFDSLDSIPTNTPMAFVVTTAAGKSFVISTMEGPFPVIKVKSSLGNPKNEVAVFSYTITLSAEKSLIPCSV